MACGGPPTREARPHEAIEAVRPSPAPCPADRADCDGAQDNGCEASLLSRDHCGACGKACPADLDCVAGRCIVGLVELALGGSHSCARTQGGVVYCWGLNGLGQLGLSGPEARLTPTPVPAFTDSSQIVAGRYFTCARSRKGRVACVGDRGQLGNAPPTGGSTPVVLPFQGVVDITAGANHACALLATGEAYCWGGNVRGQLGDGVTTEYQVSPVKVAGLSGAVALVAGNAHTCALLKGGAVACWGMNQYGQLGDGTFEDRPLPTRVPGLEQVEQLSCGEYHSCARLHDGSVRCFGRNEHGQLGRSEEDPSPRPVALAVPAATTVASGERHTCSCSRQGQLHCVGDNESGQLGLGADTLSRVAPAVVTLAEPCALVSAGARHTCVLGSLGGLSCFGLNDGQIGDGSADLRPLTTQVSLP